MRLEDWRGAGKSERGGEAVGERARAKRRGKERRECDLGQNIRTDVSSNMNRNP